MVVVVVMRDGTRRPRGRDPLLLDRLALLCGLALALLHRRLAGTDIPPLAALVVPRLLLAALRPPRKLVRTQRLLDDCVGRTRKG
jgi:hypothetical protein